MMYHSSRLYEGKTGLRQNRKVRTGDKIRDEKSLKSNVVFYYQISGVAANVTRMPHVCQTEADVVHCLDSLLAL